MLTRRDLLKGGGATVMGGLAASRLDPPAGATVPDGQPPAFPAWMGGVRLGASGALL